MESKETLILQQFIESWITKNIEKVIFAQELASKILNYGFIDTTKTLPFQILPTDISDSSGNLVCKLFVNLDNPIYGYFSIEIFEDGCSITCPSTYHTSHFITTNEDCHIWLDKLDEEMNSFYEISSAAEQQETTFCNLKLNELLENYKQLVKPEVEKIKNFIAEKECATIISGSVFALAKDAQRDFSKALLLPSMWAVFKSIDDLPDPDEDFTEYIDEEQSNELFEKLVDFAKTENYYAAPIYLAQRICLQSGIDVFGYSLSEESFVAAASTEENGEFVLPPIDIDNFNLRINLSIKN